MTSNTTEPVGWRAAHESAVRIPRSDLAVIRVFGRDPVRMVQGLLTNEVAGLEPGDATYAALLTPKGRMLADLRVVRRSEDILLVCDVAATGNIGATLRKYVPPLFARFEETPELLVLGFYGPAASRVMAERLDPGSESGSESGGGNGRLEGVREDHGIHARIRGADVNVIRDGDAGVPGWLLIGSPATVSRIEADAKDAAVAASLETFDVLRLEAGRPRWGTELSEEVIPIEAGLTDRAISTTKGCYTGQEVIIRILHRGHVNRRLMGLRLGQIEAPAPGTGLFRAGDPKQVARVTSAADSPSLREMVALGYVRREIEAGAVLHLGSPEGPVAVVTDLPFAR